jgi:Protein of unknown function (DUF3634)
MMLPAVLLITLTVLVLWGLWSVARPRAAFVVRIANGTPHVAHGTVTQAFLQEMREVCGRNQVKNGVVRGVVKDRRIALEFSDGMPAPCRQQLRNLWLMSGWSAE